MKRLLRNITASLTAGIVALTLASSCSPKKNTAASRNYQAFITRYNIYYNGDTHYKETLADMENKYEDDYSQLVFVHPAEARRNPKSPQPPGNFDRSIEKAQKAIQLRSIKKKPARKAGRSSDPEYKAWLKREEYNPFLHNAWMMMGRSQFNNGDFLGAASTFFYISKHFTWLPQTVLEAQIWQARSYCSLDWLFEAETILRRIKPEQVADNKTLRYLYNLTSADFQIQSKDYEKAIPYLQQAVADAKGSQKPRLNFLLGQVMERTGDNQGAYKAFKSAGSSNSATYRTKFNARIKQSEVFTGTNIEPEVKALQRMTRYDRNKTYLDQIYYAIGNLYLSRGDTAKAMSNYALAVDKSTRKGIDRALAQLKLGGLYYDKGEYVKAQPCYAEALPQIPDNYPDYKTLKRRSDNLDELAVYAANVTLQDSLLKLSYMTVEEQTAVAERLIAELKKKEAEEAEKARREEYLANQAAQQSSQTNANTPTTYTLNTDDSWYFYNSATVTAGKTDFQRRWGSRKLEDDWRRRNKASYAFTTEENSDESDNPDNADSAEGGENGEGNPDDEKASKQADDPHFVEYYLKQIPKDDKERAVANDVIQEGLYNMGVILKDKLEDFPAAETEFNRLLERYPDNVYRLDTYYNLYLMYVRSGDTAMAEHYRLLIVEQFADSNYGKAMADPRYIENLRQMDARQQQLYDEAYEAYLANKNKRVHEAYAEMSRDFPMSKIMPKFMFIDALAYVTENKPDQFKESLTTMLQRYPDTDLTPYASAYIKGLNAGRKLNAGTSNMRGMIWDIRLGNDSTATANDTPIEFDLNPDDSQLLILLYPTDEVAPNQLLYDVARHNFSSFVVKDFDLEQMNFGRLGLLIIKPFDNLRELNHYRKILSEDTQLQLPSQVRPVVISVKNFETLINEGRSFDDYFRFAADKTYRDTEERVLPPEIFGESYGLPEEPTESPETTEPTDDVVAPEAPEAIETPIETPVETTVEAPVETPVETPVKAPETPVKEPVKEPVKAPETPVKAPETPAKKIVEPDYPTGSEGDDDDPLLMNP
jgi:tetratricopeptide (TPR) repeat protein